MLLDTHVWLWSVSDESRLSREALAAIQDAENDLFLSVASAWEIAIKVGRGRLRLPAAPGSYVPMALERTGVTLLGIDLSHVTRVADLPPHHRDPFDRLLVAQAQLEALTLVSADPKLAAYEVDIIQG